MCAARTSRVGSREPVIGQSDRSDASRRASVVPCAGASAVLLRLYVTTMEETDQPERVPTQGHDTPEVHERSDHMLPLLRLRHNQGGESWV